MGGRCSRLCYRLAAEYPQGLCDELAKSYRRFLESAGERRPSWSLKLREDERGDGMFSKKAKVENENSQRIGGLRNPWPLEVD